MSIKVMSWVWTTKLTGPQKLLLMAIADHCNDIGEDAFPSIERLAEKCTVTERTVQRTIIRLEELEILHVQERAAWRPRKSGQRCNLFTIIGYKRDFLEEDISLYLVNARGDTHVTRIILKESIIRYQPSESIIISG